MPGFEEVQPEVKAAWLEEKQSEIKRTAFATMRARYTVVVPPIDAAALANLRITQSAIAAPDVAPQ